MYQIISANIGEIQGLHIFLLWERFYVFFLSFSYVTCLTKNILHCTDSKAIEATVILISDYRIKIAIDSNAGDTRQRTDEKRTD